MSKRREVSITFDHELGMTRQEFRKECNINAIMAKYQRTGIVDHIAKHSPQYGEYNPVEYQEALNTIIEAEEMFSELPSKARKFFDNDPAKFMEYVHNPDNVEKLKELGLASEALEAPQTTEPVPNPTPQPDNASEANS